MGTFTKQKSYPMDKIIPYISEDPGAVVWSSVDIDGETESVSVQDVSDLDLNVAYDEFIEQANTPKVLRYIEEHDVDTFHHVDYRRALNTRLCPKRTFDTGTLIRVEYFSEVSFDQYGQEVFSDLVVQEDYDYQRNADGFAQGRTLHIRWVSEAEVFHPTEKKRVKTYNLIESIKETDRRRANILDILKTQMIGIFVQGMAMTVDQAIQTGQGFFEHHINHIVTFKEIGEVQALIDDIAADSHHAWLDVVIMPPSVTMRSFIINQLSGAFITPTTTS